MGFVRGNLGIARFEGFGGTRPMKDRSLGGEGRA